MNALQAPIQTRDADGRTKKERAVLNPLRTAVVVIDLWDYHWCRTWSGRAGTLAQRILVALRHARQLGMTVIYAPTNFVAAYSGHPQRERIAAIPEHRAPSPYDLSAPPYDTEFRLYRADIPELPKWPGDMCGAKYGCTPNYGGNAMLPWLEIEPEDLICGDGQELYNFCAEKGVENLIYVGGATNMCLVAKPEGIINMATTGLNCYLASDLTEAYSAGLDSEEHDRHTQEAIAYIERWLCPSLKFAELAKTELPEFVMIKPWGFAQMPQLFDASIEVTLSCPGLKNVQIRYTLDGSEVRADSPAGNRLCVEKTCVLRAAAFLGGERVSEVSESYYRQLPPVPPKPDRFITELPFAFRTQKGYVTWWNEVWPDNKPGPAVGRSFDGSDLTARGRVYTDGIGVDAPSQLVFDIPEDCGTFTARAALCESDLQKNLASETAAYAEVVFRVFVDGELKQESLPMHLGDEPWRFCVQLPAGSRRISLTVQAAEPGRSCNLANWLEAGFVLKNISERKQEEAE